MLFSEIFKVEAVHPYSGNVFLIILHPASADRFSTKWKQCFSSELFSCFFFDFFQRNFKVEPAFLYKGSTFFNKSSIRLVETDFLSSGKYSLIRAIFLLVETIIEIREKHFLYIFQRLLPMIVFLRLVEKYFSKKSYLYAGGNGF